MDSRNTDRHLGNFGALIDNDTISVIRMAPVFDNNRSLLFDMDDDQLKNTEWCGKDYYFNIWSHQYVYKYKSSEIGQKLY